MVKEKYAELKIVIRFIQCTIADEFFDLNAGLSYKNNLETCFFGNEQEENFETIPSTILSKLSEVLATEKELIELDNKSN